MDEARMEISRARAALIISQPFFGSIALKLKVVESDHFETMATDGVTLHYNPEFVLEQKGDELKSVVAHEVMHIALKHHLRQGERDHWEWNEACDYAVNPILDDCGFTLPKDCLLDKAFAGKSAEEIYKLRGKRKPPPQEGGGQPGQGQGTGSPQQGAGSPPQGASQPGNGEGDADSKVDGSKQPEPAQSQPLPPSEDPGRMGEVLPSPAGTGEADLAKADQEVQIALAQAAQAARAAGSMPASLERFVKAVLEPEASWEELLHEFVSYSLKNDYRWNPPNRRYIAQGLYLPSARSDEVGPIVVAVDTSGSVSKDQLEQMAAEIYDISETVKPERIHVVYCDAKVKNSEEFQYGEVIETLDAKGGGGTLFQPVFDWVEEQGIEPQCLIYMTDMAASDVSRITEPDYPVLWACTYAGYNESRVPFGEIVMINVDG